VTRKVSSEQPGGAYSLFELVSQPQGGSPPHLQHRGDEAFYVLEGEYEFPVEGRTLRLPAGSATSSATSTAREMRGRIRSR
jgi:quercetin dioxygenase-like cupin family protein